MVRQKATSIQYINALRIIATYAVVTGHIAIWASYTAPPLGLGWWVLKWIHLVALWVIPAFVMISGILLLDNPRDESAADFYKRRMHRIAVPVIIITQRAAMARECQRCLTR